MEPTEAPPKPIIIINKKVAAHGGHHGGAWKVAYADFVTAMMALFIVLWLTSSSEEVKKAVGGYFLDPSGKAKQTGSGMAGSGETLAIKKDDMHLLKDKIEQAIKQSAQFQKMKNQIQMTVTGEGLRIELIETDKGMFFESGRPQPTEIGHELLSKLAEEVGHLPNRVVIEGHTDAKPFSAEGGYSNWELSSDRANSARRIMEECGLRSDQVQQVRGFADQDLRVPAAPQDASNRRVSIIIKYGTPPEVPVAPPATQAKAPAPVPAKKA
jgi:chemotaxis protein MotB